MKFRPLEMTVVRAEGYTEKINIIVTIRIYFANAHKICSKNITNRPGYFFSYVETVKQGPKQEYIYIYILMHNCVTKYIRIYRVAQKMYTLFTHQYLWNKFK